MNIHCCELPLQYSSIFFTIFERNACEIKTVNYILAAPSAGSTVHYQILHFLHQTTCITSDIILLSLYLKMVKLPFYHPFCIHGISILMFVLLLNTYTNLTRAIYNDITNFNMSSALHILKFVRLPHTDIHPTTFLYSLWCLVYIFKYSFFHSYSLSVFCLFIFSCLFHTMKFLFFFNVHLTCNNNNNNVNYCAGFIQSCI